MIPLENGKRKEPLMNAKDASLSFLSVERGRQQGQAYELHQEVVQIGRIRGNDIMLTDPTVSQFHARIVRLEEGTYRIQDMRSANGVALNERMLGVGYIQPLQDGDRIQLGEVVLLFHWQPQEPTRHID
jgi:pSer/pThr/pTyr-binding forkhead associated (FHA) protein